ncbi:MAG: type VI secretion system contractile sheath large subunit [Desulfosarcina sp.]|nr:type VI secretion system contractile sheath large subunit [Desulfosarcina sp.]
MAEEQTLKQPQAGADERPTKPSHSSMLLQKEIKPRTDRAQEQVENAVRTLAEYVLKDVNLVSADVIRTIEAIKAEIDGKLTRQINQILHQEDFQKLESAWRGLHYLVNNTETDDMLKIKIMNISKAELGGTLKKYKGTRWDTSPVFKKIYGAEYDRLGGEPYGCLVGDYYFDHSPPDVELLGEMAKIAAASHAPFISAAAPSVMQMDSWSELSAPADLAKKFRDADYASWRSLRESDDARYLGLAMPRFLARLPYGAKTDPVELFDFEEEVEDADTRKYVWANSAYAMAANINRAFKFYGWCSRIRGVESGGAVDGLPVHTFATDDGGVDMKCPTEIGIGDRREAELAKLGFMPLVHRKNSDFAAFIGAQSLQKPAEYEDPDATANANLAARLPYLFACCRFAHYLKCIVRDKIGSFKERDDMQKWLQKWILQYVDGDPANSSETTKAKKPLAAAEVTVAEVEGNPGYYTSNFYLRPHYQLEGLTVSLRLVSKLPSVKN